MHGRTVCVLLSVITYCRFPSLRTLPGRHTLYRMCSLLLAQLTFLGGIGLTDYLLACTAAAIAIHYGWLCVFSWMLLCTFLMLRVFRSKLPSPAQSNNVPFLLLALLCGYGAPALVVTTMAILQFCNCVPFKISYGSNRVCFICSQYVIIATFAAPVGAMLVVNYIMFVMIMIQMKSSSITSANTVTRSRRSNVAIYGRMSCLLGLTWVFDILGTVTDIQALWFAFIIATSLNGVFIFISYICNIRVLQLWCSRF
jgi:hypothetical protein